MLLQDILEMIPQHTNNIKHRCIAGLLYSAGLRRSELLNLKLNTSTANVWLLMQDRRKETKTGLRF